MSPRKHSVPPCKVTFNSRVTLCVLARVEAVGGGAGERWDYVKSFSRDETQLPPDFDRALRAATDGRPERYAELIERIETRALAPARERARAEAFRREGRHVKETVLRVTRQLQELVSAYPLAQHLTDDEGQTAARKLWGDAGRLALAAGVDAGVHADSGMTSARMEQGSQSPIATRGATTEAPTSRGPGVLATHGAEVLLQDTLAGEDRLNELLKTAAVALEEVDQMMPADAGVFAKGYKFQAATVDAFRRLWIAYELADFSNRRDTTSRQGSRLSDAVNELDRIKAERQDRRRQQKQLKGGVA